MIKRGLLLVTFLTVVLSVQGTDNEQRYEKNMKAAIQELYSAQDVESLTAIVNKFERIGNAEEGKWHPFYYASYGSLMKAIYSMNSDKAAMDPFLDEAQSYLDKAEGVESNVETVLLQGYIHMIRLTVDPASRGQQYSGQSSRRAVGRRTASLARASAGNGAVCHSRCSLREGPPRGQRT